MTHSHAHIHTLIFLNEEFKSNSLESFDHLRTPLITSIAHIPDSRSVMVLSLTMHTPSFPQSLQFVPLSSPSYYPHTLSHRLPQYNPLLTQTPLNQTPTTKLMIAQPQDLFPSSLFLYCMLRYVCAIQRAPVLHSNLLTHMAGKKSGAVCCILLNFVHSIVFQLLVVLCCHVSWSLSLRLSLPLSLSHSGFSQLHCIPLHLSLTRGVTVCVCCVHYYQLLYCLMKKLYVA